MSRRAEALRALDSQCPRCGAAREPEQEYCLECGLRLPPRRGAVPALRRAWLRRIGWYPGDWIWVSLLMLAVAAAGAALAIAFGAGEGAAAGTTVVALPPPARPSPPPAVHQSPKPPPARHAKGHRSKKPAVPPKAKPTAPPKAKATAPPNGRLSWPAGRNGWTIVLFSYPASGGSVAPYATAAHAAAGGLPQVGVLDSSDFASLHPGYDVVFSGIYGSQAEAEAALPGVHAAGFGSAYTRQIAR